MPCRYFGITQKVIHPPPPRHLLYLSKDKKRQSTSRLPKNRHRSSPYDIFPNDATIPTEIQPKKVIFHFPLFTCYYPLISSSRALNRMGGHGVLLTPISPVIPTQNNTGARRCALFISVLFFDGVLVGSGWGERWRWCGMGWLLISFFIFLSIFVV